MAATVVSSGTWVVMSFVLVLAALGLGVAAVKNARHVNQLKHHELDPGKNFKIG